MKRSIWLLWVVLILVAFAAITGGCGGGSGGGDDNPGTETNFAALEGNWTFDNSKPSGGTITAIGYGESSLSLLKGSAEIKDVKIDGNKITLDLRCAFDWRINTYEIVYTDWGARADGGFEEDIEATIAGNKIHLLIDSEGVDGDIAISNFDITLNGENEIYVEEKGTALEYGSYSAYYHLKKTGTNTPEPDPGEVPNPDVTAFFAQGRISGGSCIYADGNRAEVFTQSGYYTDLTLTVRHYASDPPDVVYINTGNTTNDMYFPPEVEISMQHGSNSTLRLTISDFINNIRKFTQNGNIYTGSYQTPEGFETVEIELDDDEISSLENPDMSQYRTVSQYKKIKCLTYQSYPRDGVISTKNYYLSGEWWEDFKKPSFPSLVDSPYLPAEKLPHDQLKNSDTWYHSEGSGWHYGNWESSDGPGGRDPKKGHGYKLSDKYAIDLNLPGNAELGYPVFAVERGVVKRVIASTGYIEIEHDRRLVTDSYIVNDHAISADINEETNQSVYVPRWYSGYMHLDSFEPGIEEGKSVEKDAVIGYIGSKGTDNTHLHFAVYDRDGYSFSPYVLSDKYKLINYGGYDTAYVEADQMKYENAPTLAYRNNQP
ncbi:MAG: M23 family metallopeptidase [Synergistaceae bacterium]|jgi:murein DD-endopeptidase MepM/ murein hydrolase activator NlpD|nr:M23 family metallopeptidase [Synergistaceae bacterium]